MANNDPRIKASENSPYMKARAARLARAGRGKPVDVTQIPRLATLLPESRAANDAHLQNHLEQQSQGEHSLYHAAASGRFMRQPPSSPWGPTKEQLVNPK